MIFENLVMRSHIMVLGIFFYLLLMITAGARRLSSSRINLRQGQHHKIFMHEWKHSLEQRSGL